MRLIHTRLNTSLCVLTLTLLVLTSSCTKGSKDFKSKNTKLALSTIYNGDQVIWGFDFLPQDKMVFTYRSGAMKLLDLKTSKVERISGVPKSLAHGQGGLLDVAYSSKNQRLYLTFSAPYERAISTFLASGKLKGAVLTDVKVHFGAKTRSRAGQHFGSRIVFKDDFVYFGIGDRGVRESAQDLGTHTGSIIRLHLSGQIPKDNPFVNQPGALPEIWSYGHRNPQGLAFNSQTGDLWEAEFGPRGGDELNIVEAGKNYGWPVITYGREYYGPKIGTTKKAGMEQPIRYYVPSISPSGINFYTGDRIPEWKGNLFVANLSSQHLRRIKIQGQKIVEEEELLGDKDWRFRQVREGPDERLYFSTDSGKIVAIEPAIK